MFISAHAPTLIKPGHIWVRSGLLSESVVIWVSDAYRVSTLPAFVSWGSVDGSAGKNMVAR